MGYKFHIVHPAEGFKHTHTIIFLHGKGSDCHEFAEELFESEASEAVSPGKPRTIQALFPSVRWVFPSAPLIRSARFDCIESQWFDIWAVERPDEQYESQVESMSQSRAIFEDVIAKEEIMVPREKIFLAGISQGFATAVTAALLLGGAFAGLVGLCTWMPRKAYEAIQATEGPDKASKALASMNAPIFLAHSQGDGVVPVENGRALRDYLSQSKSVVEWHEYASDEHWIVEPEGVDDLVKFLRVQMRRPSITNKVDDAEGI